MGDPSDKKDYVEFNRLIYLTGVIDEKKVENVVGRLLSYECQDPTKDIIMFIDSYGGIVDSFVSIHDAMKMLRCDVATVCIGKAMSCAQMLLISGTKGKRFMTPNSRVMIHEINSGMEGKITNIENDVSEVKRMQKHIVERLILKYTTITKDHLTKIIGKDKYFTANDCLKYGIVDHIMDKPSTLYNRIKL